VLFFIITLTPIMSFADHTEITIIPVAGSGTPGCEITSRCFIPSVATVDVGSVVTFLNTDTAAHTFTAETGSKISGEFDTGLLFTGNSFEFVPKTSGVISYLCVIHPWMTGLIIVQEAEIDDSKPSQNLGMTITATADKGSDTITVTGKTVSNVTDVTFRVTFPNGTDVVAIDQVTPDDNGNFVTKFKINSLWKENGFYTITAKQNIPQQNSLYSLKVLVEIKNGITERTFVTDSTLEAETFVPVKPIISNDSQSTSHVTHVQMQKSTYSNNEKIVFTGITDGKSLVSIIIRDSSNNYKGMVSDPSSSYGFFSTIPKSVSNIFSEKGTYTATAFTDMQKEKDGKTIQLYYDGSSVFAERFVPEPSSNPIPQDNTPPKILKPADITVDANNQDDGIIVNYDVLAIDDTDNLVKPLCNPRSGSFFTIGNNMVTCHAVDSAGNNASPISFSITVIPSGIIIPEWVKNIAQFWCENKLENSSFIEGIQYLIDNDIITVMISDEVTMRSQSSPQDIPEWVKNNACWWSQGLINDEEFASGIEYLVSNKIILV